MASYSAVKRHQETFRPKDLSIMAELHANLMDHMRSQVASRGGSLGSIPEGTYNIVSVVSEPLARHIGKTTINDTRYAVSDHSQALVTLLLEGSDGHLTSMLLPADAHTTDFMEDLVGRRLISDGKAAVIEAAASDVAMPSPKKARQTNNAISSRMIEESRVRDEFFSTLGLHRLESLRPGIAYTLTDVDEKTVRNPLSRVRRSFVRLKFVEETGPYVDGAAGITKDETQINVRIYTDAGDEARQMRIRNFFMERTGRSFCFSEPIPTIVKPNSLNPFLAGFVSATEQPMLRRGEVYVLDGVERKDEFHSVMWYHSIEVHRKVVEEALGTEGKTAPLWMRKVAKASNIGLDTNAPASGLMSIFRIAGYNVLPPTDETDALAGRYYRLRSVHRAMAYLDRRRPSMEDPDRGFVFTVAEDIYGNMLDFMRVPEYKSPADLFDFCFIDFDDQDAIDILRRASEARGLMRSSGFKEFGKDFEM